MAKGSITIYKELFCTLQTRLVVVNEQSVLSIRTGSTTSLYTCAGISGGKEKFIMRSVTLWQSVSTTPARTKSSQSLPPASAAR